VAFPVGRGRLSRWKYSKASRYLAVSNFVAEQLNAAGVDRARIDIVYDAVADVAQANWDPAANAVALQSDDPGKCSGLITQAAAQAGIPIVFSTDLPRDLRRASMFLYLTSSEGLGSAAILSMAMGIPVIASRVEGLAEVFEDGVSGLYTANDPVEAAKFMRTIIDTPGLAEKLSTAGRRRAKELFSADRLLRETVAAYQKVLGE
jgi:glycosyltransferase involved in cell wall biosynthesis